MAICSINKLTDFTGISYRVIKKRLASVKPVRKEGRSFLYDSAEVLPVLYEAEARPTNAANLTAERARLTKAQADRQEMQLATEREEVAPVVLLERALARGGTMIVAKLEAIPPMIRKRAPSLDALTLRAIERDLAELRNAISRLQLSESDLAG